jgi:hypothetical protein
VIIYPAAIAAQLRNALHEGDTATLAALLHPDVRFEPLDATTPATYGSAAALARIRDFADRTHALDIAAAPLPW